MRLNNVDAVGKTNGCVTLVEGQRQGRTEVVVAKAVSKPLGRQKSHMD
jgi:hypothetical protein